MKDDPIVNEVRAIRQAQSARFEHDLRAIVADLQRQQKNSGRKYVSYPPRPSRTESITGYATPPRTEVARSRSATRSTRRPRG